MRRHLWPHPVLPLARAVIPACCVRAGDRGPGTGDAPVQAHVGTRLTDSLGVIRFVSLLTPRFPPDVCVQSQVDTRNERLLLRGRKGCHSKRHVWISAAVCANTESHRRVWTAACVGKEVAQVVSDTGVQFLHHHTDD